MLTEIHPKLPMRDKAATRAFYIDHLGFTEAGPPDFADYLILSRGPIEIHFFLFKELDPLQNYGQVYIRTNDIGEASRVLRKTTVALHRSTPPELKPWGQWEFSVKDPDNNLLTFGQAADHQNPEQQHA